MIFLMPTTQPSSTETVSAVRSTTWARAGQPACDLGGVRTLLEELSGRRIPVSRGDWHVREIN